MVSIASADRHRRWRDRHARVGKGELADRLDGLRVDDDLVSPEPVTRTSVMCPCTSSSVFAPSRSQSSASLVPVGCTDSYTWASQR